MKGSVNDRGIKKGAEGVDKALETIQFFLDKLSDLFVLKDTIKHLKGETSGNQRTYPFTHVAALELSKGFALWDLLFVLPPLLLHFCPFLLFCFYTF